MCQNVLHVQMFGGFNIRYGDKAVVFNKAESSKSVRLLQMLLLSSKHGISKSELIENLYGWTEKADLTNRNRNLNNLIYRLKGHLTACGLPDDEYVEIREGMCFFRTRLPVETDVWQFEEAIAKADDAEGEERRLLLLKANELYRGELLPVNLSEVWFFHKSNYFKKLYLKIVEELEAEFIRIRDYKSRLQLYAKTAAFYPFDEWQIRQIQCNLEIYRYDEAMEIYNHTMELYAKEFRIPPAKEMQRCFESLKLMDENHQRDTSDMNSWRDMDKVFIGNKNDIKKALLGEDDVKGAYYCPYPSFVDYCHLVARARDRNKFKAVLMFLTLSQRGKKEKPRQIDLPKQMDLLKNVIGDTLRTGDAYTRYGDRHFILMLVKTDADVCSGIFRRIEAEYTRRSGKGELWYYTDMTQDLVEAI